MHLPLAETGEAPAGFYISAPADIVRPHLAKWKAESTMLAHQKMAAGEVFGRIVLVPSG